MSDTTTVRLFIMRHAKAGWGGMAEADFDRSLTPRGIAATAVIGQWFARQTVQPQKIIASPAVRARQTIELVCQHGGFDSGLIEFNEDLYLASLKTLCGVIERTASRLHSIMLVGHNPGLEELVTWLAGEDDLTLTASGKAFTTANVAVLELPRGWRRLSEGAGRLCELVRPKELMSSAAGDD